MQWFADVQYLREGIRKLEIMRERKRMNAGTENPREKKGRMIHEA